ncbi:major capsid protein [Microviridae sp.]|nr:major capsid protein [Microviridae sp.]
MAKSSNFAKVATANIQRSRFDRGSTHKTTFDANYLTPVFVDEVLPGDSFNLNMTSFCRLATPIKPSMDNLHMDVHFFFVPNRLVWDNWERFMGAQDNPDDSTDFLIPTLNVVGDESFYAQSIFDYFGIPPVTSGTNEVNALPFRAYNLCFNEWYRDQNLQDSVKVETGDSDDIANYTLLRRGKRHDYFTSALPFPQKGEPVGLTLSGNAPVVGSDSPLRLVSGDGTETNVNMIADASTGSFYGNGLNTDTNMYFPDKDVTTTFADMTEVTAVTINALRQAFQLQRFLERDARGGTRYIEVIKSHFGVTNPDFRLQRPEYLGGSHDGINMTTIAQTAPTIAGYTPQANLSAMGIASGRNNCFNKSFTEHGYIIGIASVYADLTYQQGLNRMWQRQTRVDFYWPAFSHLGEQEIFNSEIYAQGTSADKEVFGYQERYADYRYSPNRISGLFRSTHSTSLDVWHYAQDFDSLPVLSPEFIVNDAPVKRNSAVPSEPDFICDFQFNLKCTRPMPMFGTPGFVDQF